MKCHVTGKTSRGGSDHDSRDDFKYVTPILKKEAMDKSDVVGLIKYTHAVAP